MVDGAVWTGYVPAVAPVFVCKQLALRFCALNLVHITGQPGLNSCVAPTTCVIFTSDFASCRLEFCETLLNAATAYGIDNCWQWKPLLDGKQVGSCWVWWFWRITAPASSAGQLYGWPDMCLSYAALAVARPACQLSVVQVMAAVGMKSGGPQLGRLMAATVEWQLAHPQGSAEECREWLQREHAAMLK
jgi:hypothetical protein